MSRTLSNAPGSDSPLKANLVHKAPFSNAKLTRKENHRELRHDMMNISLVVEPDKFLELFVPLPAPQPGKKARRKPSNPFTDMTKPTTEKKMYEDYPKHLNKIIRSSGYAFVATPYKADNATDSKLAVDCGMYPRNRMPKKDQMKGMDPATKKDFRHVCWSGIDLPAECKVEDDPFEDSVDTGRPHSDKRKDASGQALSYIELMYHHQQRTFVFMLIFVGVHCRLLRVDRSGLFVTKRFNVTTTDYLVEFLWRYTQLSPEGRGYDTTAEYINPSPLAQDPLATMMNERLLEVEKAGKEEEHVVKLWKDALNAKWPWWKLCIPDEVTGKDRWFLVGRPSFQAPGVRGRGTRCYIAVEVLERDKKTVLDTKFVHLKDCWRVLADDASDPDLDIRKEGDTLKKLNVANVERVPTLFAHGDIKGQDTSATPKAWKTVNDKFKCRLKTHQHYRLVVEEIGKPLSEFAHGGELVSALFDCIQAHEEAMRVKIIHRDISGGNILLYKKEGDEEWHGLLTDWELSKDSEYFPTPRQHGRTGTLQFSAARVLDDPSKAVCVADELECFFHVLIYYAVRFLKHNLPDESVGLFLNNYFDASSGLNQKGQLTAPALKRTSMKVGSIDLDEFGVTDTLRFIWLEDAGQQGEHALQNADPEAHATTAPVEFDHPLNQLIKVLLSWFSALYTLEALRKPSSGPTTSSGGAPSQAPKDSTVIRLRRSRRDASQAEIEDKPKQLSPAQLEELKLLAAKLDDQSNVLDLIEKIALKPFPTLDKGKDKRPEKGYAPCSPETPQFTEISGFTDFGADSEDEVEDGGLAVLDAPAPGAFVELAAADGGRDRDERRRAIVVAGTREDELEPDDSSRSPSPCPVRPKRATTRPKRDREDDRDAGREPEDGAAPGTFGKRSRY